MNIEQSVQAQLLAMQDLKYRDFQCRLMPTVPPETVIGVRTPALRKYAKAFAKTPEAAEFLKILPHPYYEENNLHGFLIESMKDYGQTVARWTRFSPMWTTGPPATSCAPGSFKSTCRSCWATSDAGWPRTTPTPSGSASRC